MPHSRGLVNENVPGADLPTLEAKLIYHLQKY